MAYTNSPLVTYTNLTKNRNLNRNHEIDTITIHCMVGQFTAKACVDYFATTKNESSSNYCVGYDGSIGLSVEEKDRAWTSSSGANDHRAVTIEVACDAFYPYNVTDAAYNALIKLVADICSRNKIKKLLWKNDKSLIGQIDKQNMTIHRWFAATECPGEFLYSHMSDIATKANKLIKVVEEEPVKESANTTTSSVKKGDVVTVKSGAKYYQSTKVVPNFVINSKWIVTDVKDARVVLGSSIDGVYNINSPVNIADIVVVNSTPTQKENTTTTINVGDIVSIKSGATYYGIAVKIPEYVRELQWYVTDVKGSRVVVGKSTNDKYNINSAIDAKYLTVVKGSSTTVEFKPYVVKTNIAPLSYYTGPGTNNRIAGTIKTKGAYTIIEESIGIGSTKGWGLLKSKAGWIPLDQCTKL